MQIFELHHEIQFNGQIYYALKDQDKSSCLNIPPPPPTSITLNDKNSVNFTERHLPMTYSLLQNPSPELVLAAIFTVYVWSSFRFSNM